MHTLKVTAAGQVSIPAAIRRRWNATSVTLVDEGDRVVIAPVPDDPIGAVLGMFANRGGPTTDQIRAQERAEDDDREDERFGK